MKNTILEDATMCFDLQDWQKKITEYFSKQEGQPYPTSNQIVLCGFVALHRRDWQKFIYDNKDNIAKRYHTKIILKNNERWVWVNPSNEELYRGCRYYKILADKYINENFIKTRILPCCSFYCKSFEWF